jgi:SH3-like domain-containing protein
MRYLLTAVFFLTLVSGCADRQKPEPSGQTGAQPQVISALVKYNKLGVRKEPLDNKDPKNYLTTVNRGEKVTVLQQDTLWAKVRLSDDKEGWIQSRYLVPSGVRFAVMLISELMVYKRPDPSSPRLANDTAMTRQGTLLWITKEKDGFAECQFPSGKSGWIASGELVTDSAEVAAARLLEQARTLVAESKMEEAASVYQKIADQYGSSKVAAVVAEESGIKPKSE